MKKEMILSQKLQIIIAIILAIITGIVFHGNEMLVDEILSPVGNAFLNIIKCFMIPLIFFSIIVGIINLKSVERLKSIGIKILLWFSLTTIIASIIGIAIGMVMDLNIAGLNLGIESGIPEEATNIRILSTLLSFIPQNIISTFVDSNIIQIIFLSTLFGCILIKNQEKFGRIINACQELNEFFKSVLQLVLKALPVGIFALLTPVIIKNDYECVLVLGKIIIAYIVACLIHIILVYLPIVKCGGKIKIKDFCVNIFPAMALAFSSSSSLATLGTTMESTKKLGVKDEISKFTLPLGATINMDGTAIFLSIISIFIASIYGIELSILKLFILVLVTVLTSIGTPGIPGASLIIIAVTLNSLGLPLNGIGLIAGIDVILEMFGTAMNVCGDIACTVLVDKMSNKKEEK